MILRELNVHLKHFKTILRVLQPLEIDSQPLTILSVLLPLPSVEQYGLLLLTPLIAFPLPSLEQYGLPLLSPLIA